MRWSLNVIYWPHGCSHEQVPMPVKVLSWIPSPLVLRHCGYQYPICRYLNEKRLATAGAIDRSTNVFLSNSAPLWDNMYPTKSFNAKKPFTTSSNLPSRLLFGVLILKTMWACVNWGCKATTKTWFCFVIVDLTYIRPVQKNNCTRATYSLEERWVQKCNSLT